MPAASRQRLSRWPGGDYRPACPPRPGGSIHLRQTAPVVDFDVDRAQGPWPSAGAVAPVRQRLQALAQHTVFSMSTPIVVAGHADVGDVRGAARQDPGVRGRHGGMGSGSSRTPPRRRDAPKPHLLAWSPRHGRPRRIGVAVARLGEFGLGARGTGRRKAPMNSPASSAGPRACGSVHQAQLGLPPGCWAS